MVTKIIYALALMILTLACYVSAISYNHSKQKKYLYFSIATFIGAVIEILALVI